MTDEAHLKIETDTEILDLLQALIDEYLGSAGIGGQDISVGFVHCTVTKHQPDLRTALRWMLEREKKRLLRLIVKKLTGAS